ncbi:unnamed protein product [Caenorhabditis sp. 36 PRJEB53466]|nr:unnamed protein product [Caenorhabditis sp. 36 PRJEB53466]
MTARGVMPSTRIMPINSRLESTRTFPKSLNSKEVPRLSKEQLAQRRNDVIKYYNELSRKKVASSVNPKVPVELPAIQENPAELIWEQIKDLIGKMRKMAPVQGVSREDVEQHLQELLSFMV